MRDRAVEEILQLLKNDPEVQEYFFQKLNKANDPLRWFSRLIDEGYFDPSRNPAPIESPDKKGLYSIPHWFAVEALANVVAECVETENQQLLGLAKEVLDKLIASDNAGQVPIYNFRTPWLLLRAVCQLPPDFIDLGYISFVDKAVRNDSGWSLIDAEIGDAFLPRVLQGNNSDCIVALLKVVLGFKAKSAGPSREVLPNLNPSFFLDCLQKNRKAMLGWDLPKVILLARTFIQDAIEVDPFCFNAIWVPTVETHSQTISPERYGCQLTYLLRDAVLSLNSEAGLPEVRSLLESKETVFRRVAYFAIGERYGDWGSLFWSLGRNPCEELHSHEVYELIKKNCRQFSSMQLKQCIDWIEALQFGLAEESDAEEDVRRRYEAYKRREWLTALADASDSTVINLAEHYLTLNDAPISHPGFSSWVGGSHWVGEVSPISEEKFKSMPAKEAVRYVNEFTPPPRQISEDFTEVSLTAALRRFVANDPEHFLADLDSYLGADPKYQNELMRGFEEATRTKNLSNWPAVVDFALAIVNQLATTLNGTPADDRSPLAWLASTIADLLSTATNQERAGFPDSCTAATERLVVALLNLPTGPFRLDNDILTSVLNCQVGRVILCGIKISVAISRTNRERPSQPWTGPIPEEFARRLEAADNDHPEVQAMLAFSLNNLFYLDSSWAKEQLPRIFNLQRADTWTLAFSSLMLSTSVVYHEVYDLLRDGGHFDRAVGMDFVGRDVNQKFVQVVVVGYLAGWDELTQDQGVLLRLILRGKPEHLNEVGRFIWSQAQLAEGTFEDKVLPLWRLVLERTGQANTSNEYGGALSELASWLKWTKTIDAEVFGLMERALAGMDTSQFPPFFVENLADRVDSQPAEVGKLFWRFIESRTLPYYKEDVVLKIVESLFRYQEGELAMKIANYYFRHGLHFLRGIVDKYQPPNNAPPE